MESTTSMAETKKPIMGRRNGIQTTRRTPRLVTSMPHWRGCRKACRRRARARLFHWSLLVNFEWNRAQAKFGLFAVTQTTFKRTRSQVQPMWAESARARAPGVNTARTNAERCTLDVSRTANRWWFHCGGAGSLRRCSVSAKHRGAELKWPWPREAGLQVGYVSRVGADSFGES